VNRKTIAYVKKQLRKASLANPGRVSAKNRSKIDKALFKCENKSCLTAMYEGESDKNLKDLNTKHPQLTIVKGKIELDHDIPVRQGKGDLDWNDYIESLFCDESNYNAYCPSCHAKKSEEDRNENADKKV
jgi:hypothetical protein